MNKCFRIKITGGTVGLGKQGSTTIVTNPDKTVIYESATVKNSGSSGSL